MALNIIDKRAKLLGLFPRDGQVTMLMPMAQAENGAPPLMRIEFVVPTKKPEAPHWEPPPGPRLLPAPRETRKDEMGNWVLDEG
jgi:hypothetical protein